MLMMHKQIGHLSRNTETLKKNQMEIQELKTYNVSNFKVHKMDLRVDWKW